MLLTQPFFLDKSDWFPPPGWSFLIVKGKGYELDIDAGKFIWKKIEPVMAKSKESYFDKYKKGLIEKRDKYGKEILIKPMLGQSTFKILVTDAYNRSCAITQERTLPVLEAAHIKPYSKSGPHDVTNGILLRSDMLVWTEIIRIVYAVHPIICRNVKNT